MHQKSNRLSRFWQELKRRRVIHVITVYATSAFVIIELAGNLVEPLNLPERLPTIVIIILAVGFPLAVILSWLYDLTSEGVEKTKPLSEIKEGEKRAVPNAWKIATYVSFVVIIGLVVVNVMGGEKKLRAGDIQSLVILPFENYTGDDQMEWLVSGLHSQLIGDVQRISGFDVIGKTTSKVYKDAGMTLQEIALERDVDALIEADLMCHGDTICFQLRLIRAFPEEITLWSEEYREAKGQIQNLYNRITKQIADEVKIELTTGEEALLAETITIDPEAYDAYWQGKYYWDLFTPEAMEKALEYFNLAVDKDPDWGPPYAGIAEFWILMRQGSFAPYTVTVPSIYENLNKAIELDPNSANTHYVNGLVAVWTGFDWEKGEREFLKALEINPNHAHSRAYYAHLLMMLGKIEEALSEGQIALDLDPLNPMIQALYGAVLIEAGEYNHAVSFFEHSLATAPEHFVSYSTIALAYLLNGDYGKNIEALIKYLYLENETALDINKTFKEQGHLAAVEALIVEMEELGSASYNTELLQLYTVADSPSKALDLLEKMYQDRDANIPYMSTIFYSSHGPYQIEDPRFDSLLKKMNLPLREK